MSSNGNQNEGRRVSRRRFMQAGAAVGVGVVASGYVKPSITSVSVPKAFASNSPIPQICHGLTPGFWGNWNNHFTYAQMAIICAGTIGDTPEKVDQIFSDYNESPGYELTMLRVFVLCNQLTIFLTYNGGFPNPSGGYLSSACGIDGKTVSDCLDPALILLDQYPGQPGVPVEVRPYAIELKDCLDAFANMS